MNKIAWGQEARADSLTSHLDRLRNVALAWPKLLRPGDRILTFNWDILHEVILWRAKLWSYRDGYGFQCGKQGENDEFTKILLLKLHGSVNWVQENDSGPVSEIANVADFFVDSKDWEPRPHYAQAQSDSGRKLVLPTYLKDISSNRVLLDVWTKAHSLIARANELYVIGYSLHPVDHPARLLFGTALLANIDLKRVTVVSPDAIEWDKFLAQLKLQLVRVPLKFEDWLSASASTLSSSP
ncbi:MAG TPA: hypothetical protein VHM93_21400 [Candidatus Acidoferrum sp.]|nr:hypothetical protein [Candidatus Acidoferrum sp.]